MELSQSIKLSWAAVIDSGVPEHVQKLAFQEALRASLGVATPAPPQQRQVPPKRAAPRVDSSTGVGEVGGAVYDEQQVYAAVAEETGVPVERLELVFHVDNGVVKLVGPHGRYGRGTADQARSVARIVTVVRKLGMGQPDTSFEVIKDACESKHCYESRKFASDHMPAIDGFVVKGEGRNRRLEAKGIGIKAFPPLIEKILGEE